MSVHLVIVALDQGHVIPRGSRVFEMMLRLWGGEKATKANLPDIAADFSFSPTHCQHSYPILQRTCRMSIGSIKIK